MRLIRVLCLFVLASLLLSGCGIGGSTPRWWPKPVIAGSTTTDMRDFENHKGASAQLEAYKRAGYTLSGVREVDLPDGTIRTFECTATRKQPTYVSVIKISIDGARKHYTMITKTGTSITTTTTETTGQTVTSATD